MNEYLALHGMAQPIIDIAINNAIPAPYLLDQVLALSALHLSTQDPSKELLYHHQATELQTRALELFNKEKEDVSEVNYIPVFLFASFLGVHVLRETLSSHPDNLSAFVDGFVRYAHLHRGVRTVIERASWTHILQSELKHIMSPWGTSNENEEHTSGKETLTLSNYLDSYNAGHGSIDACQSALKDMQWVFDRSNSDHADKNLGIHAVIAWPLLISQEYIDILNQHRPEAFAVLALYATCLHRYREFWVFGGAGSHLLHLILSSIGSFWRGKLGLSVEVLSKA
jgi:hypothetical protein